MAVILRSLTLLAVTGASLALFVQELHGSWLGAFVSANVLALANRERVIIGMVVGGVAGIGTGLIAWRGNSGRLHRVAHLCAPGILLAFVPPLCATGAWSNQLNLCLAIAVFVLLGERLFRLAFAATAPAQPPAPAAPGRLSSLVTLPASVRRLAPPVLVGAGVLGYAIYMSVFTLFMHGRFQTFGFDLGQYDNVFWNTLHGHPLRCTPLGMDANWHSMRSHADLGVFFLLPIYAIKPGGAILLVIQSCVIALGAIPLYRFAARRLPRTYAAVIAFAYLFFPATHGLQFYDIHFQPIAATFVLLVIDFVDDRRYWLCAMAFVVALACREDISVGLAILGAFLMLSGHRVRPGLIMATTATAYFIVVRFVVMPSFGPWGFADIYKDLFPAGARNFGGVIATMISNPVFTLGTLLTADKLRYALQILSPLAFLPVRRSATVVSIVPGAISTLLTTEYPPTIDIGFQYSGHFVPYVFPAAVLCIAGLAGAGGNVRRRAALAALVVGTALCSIHWGAIPPRERIHGGFNTMSMRAPTPAERQKHRDIVALHAMIPPDASVAMSEAEMPHVSRAVMRTLRDTTDADYLLYGTSSGYGGATRAEAALASGEFELIAERPGVKLLKRKRLPATPALPQKPQMPTMPQRSMPQMPAPAQTPQMPQRSYPPTLSPRPASPPAWGLPKR
jgi:uncharacterized membrane protein